MTQKKTTAQAGQLIVTLDGPAGSGKSTLAKRLAKRLGFKFLDTGATYRAVTYQALREGIDLDNGPAVADLARRIRIEFKEDVKGDLVFINGEEATLAIRTREVTNLIYKVADNPAVREALVALQRQIASPGRFVTEGRDQGTVAFPDARWKFYLNASPKIRAERRVAQMKEQGLPAQDFDTILKDVIERDQKDMRRPVGALKKAADAREILSDTMTPEETLEILVAAIQETAPELFRK